MRFCPIVSVLLLGVVAATAEEAPDHEFDDTGVPAGVTDKLLAAGHQPVKSTIAPDGMSGTIQLGGGENTMWTPKYPVGASELRRMIDNEKLLLVLFFSSAEGLIGMAHENGKEFEIAAEDLIEGDSEVMCAMFDVKDQPWVREHGVQDPEKGPVIKLFRDGTPSNYHGQVSSHAIIQYVQSAADAASVELNSAAELDELLASASQPVVVGFFAGGRKAQAKTPSGIARRLFLASAGLSRCRPCIKPLPTLSRHIPRCDHRALRLTPLKPRFTAEQLRGKVQYVEMFYKSANAAKLFSVRAHIAPGSHTTNSAPRTSLGTH